MSKPGEVDNNGFPTARTARRQYQEEQLIEQLYKYILAGMNVGQICKALNIGRSTYYKYEKRAAKQERQYMEKHFEDRLITKIKWLEDSFLETYTICRNIELGLNPDPEDPKKKKVYDVGEILAAANLKAEIAISSVKLLREGPFSTVQELPDDVKVQITEMTQRKNLPTLSYSASQAPPNPTIVDKLDEMEGSGEVEQEDFSNGNGKKHKQSQR